MRSTIWVCVQGSWRAIVLVLYGASWLAYGAWDDRPYMRPIALVFAVALSVAAGLLLACDTQERQNLKEDVADMRASNAKLAETNQRLISLVPVGAGTVRAGKPLPEDRRFNFLQFLFTPGLASPVLHNGSVLHG